MGISSLFSMFGNQPSNILSQFQQFKKSFQGNPREQVQQLLDSGQMTQQQFNQLSQLATQFQQMMKGRF